MDRTDAGFTIISTVRIKPRDDVFFEQFTRVAANIKTAAHLFVELTEDLTRAEEISNRLTDLEHIGDDLNHEIIHRLNTSFVTPFDREDLYSLSVHLDDVIDLIDAGSDHILLYELETLPKGVGRQARLIADLADLTDEAMPRLSKVGELSDYWQTVENRESEADKIHRRLLAKLFSGQYKALEVMKLKEVVDDLEEAVNAFERVANTIEEIAVKES